MGAWFFSPCFQDSCHCWRPMLPSLGYVLPSSIIAWPNCSAKRMLSSADDRPRFFAFPAQCVGPACFQRRGVAVPSRFQRRSREAVLPRSDASSTASSPGTAGACVADVQQLPNQRRTASEETSVTSPGALQRPQTQPGDSGQSSALSVHSWLRDKRDFSGEHSHPEGLQQVRPALSLSEVCSRA